MASGVTLFWGKIFAWGAQAVILEGHLTEMDPMASGFHFTSLQTHSDAIIIQECFKEYHTLTNYK